MGASNRSPQNGVIRRDTAWYVAFAGGVAFMALLAIWILPATLALSPGGGPTVQTGRASYFDYVCAVLLGISCATMLLARRHAEIAELQRKPSIAWSVGPLAGAVGLALFLFGMKTHVLCASAMSAGDAAPPLPALMWGVGIALMFAAGFVGLVDAQRIRETRRAEQARRDTGPGTEGHTAR